MIEKPTVLVLGAGASVHVGYPLGGGLVDDLCRQRNSDLNNDLPMHWTPEDADRFLTRLSRSGHYSIDAFLETVPDQADLGKYLIARELKRHEDIDRLFSPNNPGWYQYVFNRLLEDNNVSGFTSSRLSIITFNYDRSLEAYLHEALIARLQINTNEASTILSHVPIVHVHGSLGNYPNIPYGSNCQPHELLDISKKIQIIHEVSDPEDGFCNREFKQSNELLNQAERIYFLGFGFHPDNIRRFRFFSPEKTIDREIHATARGIGSVELANLITRLEPFGFNSSVFTGNTCSNFFSHVAGLE
ncbi:MAG: hypothetical protein QM504_03760 [Pseudomonadota bacterium]